MTKEKNSDKVWIYIIDKKTGISIPVNETKLEKRIASILARQYYNGWKDKKLCTMTFKEYQNKSLSNWLGAGRGMIDLIKGK